jgi:putative ABC transport system substrate-binding protein
MLVPNPLGAKMRRREFLGAFGGGAVAWSLTARAQERLRRVGVLVGGTVTGRPELAAFEQALRQLGWIDGSNLKLEYRSGSGVAATIRKSAEELTALAPDVIFVAGSGPLTRVLAATRTIPVVFVSVVDPVGAGFVESMSRPGGNATGFMQIEYSLSGKWLELLKQMAPGVTRAAVLREQTEIAGIGQFAVIQSVASSLGIEVVPVNVRDPDEIERAVTTIAGTQTCGMIVTASASTLVHSERIVALATRLRLPTVYPRRLFVSGGGLASYGFDIVDQFRRGASYVARILNGEKPADLPVQAPNKYELVINLKTAKALGLTVPPALLARADEVIE